MKNRMNMADSAPSRRGFIKKGLVAGSAVTVGVGLLGKTQYVFADEEQGERSGTLSKGDAAILRFLAAAEIIESDLWLQYAELGGAQTLPNGQPDHELPGLPTGGNTPYTNALSQLDGDMPQYIHDNTEDEISHFHFINGYLKSKGADTVNLDHFKTLKGSTAEGVNPAAIGKRITNLTQLTVDTTWWGRYRSRNNNPDLDPNFAFVQAVPDLSKGQFPAIPRDNNDLTPNDHVQAIANTAAFHFCFIEQGGSSLYPSLAQRVTDPEVLRILLSIGPTETSHFQTWHDKAGNAVQPPLAPLTDPSNKKLTFPNVNSFNSEDFQANLIMPEPCPFLSRKFPKCSIIRPTETEGVAMGAVKALKADGLFIGQSNEFFELLQDLASDADAAKRER
ncbi:MAG: ferritin-like domain-containing protein [Acidobacteriaceae bacterium]|nr:ferritin-like domain-containing protein [Acidobacteriaceae bacterium]